MNLKRLFILELVMLGGFGSVFLVPKTAQLQPPSIAVQLPQFVGDWYGIDQPVSQGERDILGPDTEFVRKLYTNGRGGEVYVSIVLSGPDMNTSIHRPERCLPAQGWTIVRSDTRAVTTGAKQLEATRLLNMRPIHEEALGASPHTLYNVTYYWFVGRTETTPSHLHRTMVDMRDRLLKGYNQRWAYITVSSVVTAGLVPFGRTKEQVDSELQRFISVLTPLLHKPERS
jgi:EpsI family protein